MKTTQDLIGTVTGICRYWMVHGLGPTCHAPHVKHPTRDSAEREARRLSMANKGQPFTVLEAIDAFYIPPEAPHRLPIIEGGELPF